MSSGQHGWLDSNRNLDMGPVGSIPFTATWKRRKNLVQNRALQLINSIRYEFIDT